MNNPDEEFFEFDWELLNAYCILKYVSKEDEQDYLKMFEEVNRRTKRFLGRGSIGTIVLPDDVAGFKSLPKKLNVYRGYYESVKREGISWSLSKQVADWFAHRCWAKDKQDVPPSVVTGICSIKDVLAYTNDSGEQEIIINPRRVKGIRNIEVGPVILKNGVAESLEAILMSCR